MNLIANVPHKDKKDGRVPGGYPYPHSTLNLYFLSQDDHFQQFNAVYDEVFFQYFDSFSFPRRFLRVCPWYSQANLDRGQSL
jgi:hypothetical protein